MSTAVSGPALPAPSLILDRVHAQVLELRELARHLSRYVINPVRTILNNPIYETMQKRCSSLENELSRLPSSHPANKCWRQIQQVTFLNDSWKSGVASSGQPPLANSLFADTDLLIYDDNYPHPLPLNGMKRSDYNEWESKLNEINAGNGIFEFPDNNPAFKSQIINHLARLITRPSSRALLNDLIANGAIITVKKDQDASQDLNNITMMTTPDTIVGQNSQGECLSVPRMLAITFYHELVHLWRHQNGGKSSDKTDLSRYDYDDAEDELTISGRWNGTTTPYFENGTALELGDVERTSHLHAFRTKLPEVPEIQRGLREAWIPDPIALFQDPIDLDELTEKSVHGTPEDVIAFRKKYEDHSFWKNILFIHGLTRAEKMPIGKQGAKEWFSNLKRLHKIYWDQRKNADLLKDISEQFAEGMIRPRNLVRAEKYYLMACQLKPELYEELGNTYLFGFYGFPHDMAKAKQYFDLACKANPLLASTLSDNFQFGGYGFPRDWKMAEHYTVFGAQQDPNSYKFLADAFRQGTFNYPKDLDKAEEYYVLAAKKDPNIYLELAQMFKEGVGFTKDPAKAIAYEQLAQPAA